MQSTATVSFAKSDASRAVKDDMVYGTMPSVSSFDHSKDKMWETEYASSSALLFNALGIAGYQAFSMILVIYQVMYHRRYVMICRADLPPTTAWLCEYTKAFARFFPLVALTISLSLVSSMILIQRIYYELLRRGALMRLKKYSLREQPFFYIMAVCLLHAAGNLIIDAMTPGGEYLIKVTEPMKAPEKLEEVKQWLFYLVAPIAAFIMSVYFTYDPVYFLVPLSQYVEDTSTNEVETAKQRLNHLIIIEEEHVVEVCRSLEDIAAFKKEGCVTEDVYREIILRAEMMNHEDHFHEEFGELDESISSKDAAKGQLSQMKHMRSAILDRFWPSDLLLHPQLSDERSLEFQRISRIFNLLCLTVSAICIYIFLWFAVRDFKDVADGQWEDTSALVVEALHFLAACMYVRKLLTRALQCH